MLSFATSLKSLFSFDSQKAVLEWFMAVLEGQEWAGIPRLFQTCLCAFQFPFGRRLPCDIYWHGVSFHDNNIFSGQVNKFPGTSLLFLVLNALKAGIFDLVLCFTGFQCELPAWSADSIFGVLLGLVKGWGYQSGCLEQFLDWNLFWRESGFVEKNTSYTWS